MRAIPQLVSAPLNPIPIAEHFRRSHPPCEHSHGQQENRCKKTVTNFSPWFILNIWFAPFLSKQDVFIKLLIYIFHI